VKNNQISNLVKILLLKPSCSVRTERHDEAMSRFSQFREKRLKSDEENLFATAFMRKDKAMDQVLGTEIKII
jgi:hypothetical protein